MGIVYLVYDKRKANFPLALKTIKSNLINASTLNIFKREFDIMTRLTHPNLVKVFNYGFDPNLDCYYLTMELLKGHNLTNILSRDKMVPPKKAISFLIQLLRGLSFIHSRKIISRDIKPSNIMIFKDSIKLMDFGLSDIDAPDIKNIKGSPLYMAPEVIQKQVDHRVDIYSAGIVFYEMFAGNKPLEHSNIGSLFEILTDEHLFAEILWSSLQKITDRKIRKIISKMLAFDRDKRYKTCSEIITDISKALNENIPIETDKTKEAYVLGAGLIGREKPRKSIISKIHSNKDINKLFLLSAPIGHGKSRIFREIKKHCQINDIIFLESECSSQIKKPYFPIIRLIRQVHQLCESSFRQKHRKYTDILLKTETSSLSQDNKVKKDIITENISRFIVEFGNQTVFRTVLYINNFQFADEGTLSIIYETLKKLSKSHTNNLRIFASLRTENSGKLNDYLSRLRKETLLTIHRLYPFANKSIHEYIKNIFGRAPDPLLVNTIMELNPSNKGNPMFLSEFLKFLVNKKAIQRHGDKWKIDQSIKKLKIPQSIDGLIYDRIRSFADNFQYKQVLFTLALVKNGLGLIEIQSLFPNIPPKKIKSIIVDLENNEILQSDKIGQKVLYFFSNDIFLETVDSMITDKRAIHRLLGNTFEKLYKNKVDEYAEELAYHFSNSGDNIKAVDYLMKAGKIGESKYIGAEHILSYYYKALEIAEKTDSLFLKKIQLYKLIANILTEQGDFEKPLAMLNEALSVLIKQNCPGNEYIAIYYQKGKVFQRQGDFEKSLEYFFLTEKLLSRHKTLYMREIADCYNIIGITFLHTMHLDKALHYFEKSLDIRQELYGKFHIDVSKSYHNIGSVFIRKKEPQKSLDHLLTSLQIMNYLRVKDHNTGTLWANISIAYDYIGKTKLSLKYLEKAHALMLEMFGENHANIAFSYNSMGVFHIRRDQLNKAILNFEKANKIFETRYGKTHPFTAIALNNLGSSYCKLNDYNKAEQYIRKTIQIRKKSLGLDNPETFRSHIQLLEICNFKKDSKRTKAYAKKMLNLYRKNGSKEQVKTIETIITKLTEISS